MGGFEECFARSPVVRADAPGRVNLIGEHTDYNGGYVLPAIIPLRTSAALAPRADDRVRAASARVDGERIAEYRIGEEVPGRGWLDYVQGLTRVLAAEGVALSGFDLHVTSSVPPGAGLASSAALQVAVLRALRAAFALGLDDLELASLAQRAEVEFVGARVGIMDQMAASLGSDGAALFIDTRSRRHRPVPLPATADLIVLDSGIAHRNVGGGYDVRRSECERSCSLLGVGSLRELSWVEDLPALPEPLGRRVRHVLSENRRVLEAVEAIEGGDLERLGALLDASHASLRDDFEVSTPEIDVLVAALRAEPEVYGARLTGGGFGGAVLAMARDGCARAVAERVERKFAQHTGRRATLVVGGMKRAAEKT